MKKNKSVFNLVLNVRRQSEDVTSEMKPSKIQLKKQNAINTAYNI